MVTNSMASSALSRSPQAPTLQGVFKWWTSHLSEMARLNRALERLFRETVVAVEPSGAADVAAYIRWRSGQTAKITLPVAARFGVTKQVALRPPSGSVLVKDHVVPALNQLDTASMLRHELARITPFSSDELFWRWDVQPVSRGRGRRVVTLTMVPKSALVAPLGVLEEAGIVPDFVEVDVDGVRRRLPLGSDSTGNRVHRFARALGFACAVLGVMACLIPVGLQEWSIRETGAAIAALQPKVAEVKALKQNITASQAGHAFIKQERDRVGNPLATLAALTQAVPDDTYLTSLTLHERQMTLCGQSKSSARLMTVLSHDPLVRNPTFAAPLTRNEGATLESFCISASGGK